MEGTPGKREIKRERDKERVSLLCFCCLFWFLTKKRGFSGLLKNLKKSLSDKICLRLVLPRGAFCGQNRPPVDANQRASSKIEFKTSSSAKNRRRRVHRAFARAGPASRFEHTRSALYTKKRGRRDAKKKGRLLRPYRFGDDRRSFLGCRHRSRRRRRDPRVAARAARR